MVSPCEHIPCTCKPNENTYVPGWTTYFKPFKDKSMYWKEMYDNQKPNVSLYHMYDEDIQECLPLCYTKIKMSSKDSRTC